MLSRAITAREKDASSCSKGRHYQRGTTRAVQEFLGVLDVFEELGPIFGVTIKILIALLPPSKV